MNRKGTVLFVLAIILALMGAGGCGVGDAGLILSSVDSSALHQGIAAFVVRSPTIPVAHPGQIDWAPLPGAHILVADAGGSTVGTAVSDSAGRFFIELAAGRYLLTPQKMGSTSFPIPPSPLQVVVPQNDVAHVRIDYDTGIR